MKLRLRIVAPLALVAAASAVATGGASSYPERPVRVVIPYAPGGATDNISRVVFQGVQKVLKGTFVIESKPGGNGIIALQEVARAKPDGYTMMVGNNTTNSIVPAIYAKMPFDMRKVLRPVTKIGESPGVIVATRVNFAPNTLAEAIVYAKKNPGKLNVIIGGVGSAAHLAWLVIQQETGTSFELIPARGGMGPAVTDLLNGDAHFASMTATQAVPLVQGGKLKALAVNSAQRLPELPDVATVRGQGLNAEVFGSWQAAFVPIETPKAIVDTLFRGIKEGVALPEIKELFAKNVIVDTTDKSPEEFAAFLDRDMARWKKVAEQANIQLE